MTKRAPAAIPNELIEQKIYLIRHHKVMLDADLAELYGVTTGNLNLALRRNLKRFPKTSCFSSVAKRRNLCYCKMQEQRGAVADAHHTIRLRRAGCVDALQRSQ